MSKIKGTLRPLHDKVFVQDMQFDIEKTKAGVLLPSDDGKGSGVHPRWGKVFAIGPKQSNVKVGQWILLEHGRWSRGFTYEPDTNETIEIRLADTKAILLVSDEKPTGAIRTYAAGAGSNFNFNVPSA